MRKWLEKRKIYNIGVAEIEINNFTIILIVFTSIVIIQLFRLIMML